MNDNIKEKLKQAERNINEIEFTIRHKGAKLHTTTIAIPQYAEEVFKDGDLSFYNFFNKVTRELQAKINEEHQRMVLDRRDGSGKLVP